MSLQNLQSMMAQRTPRVPNSAAAASSATAPTTSAAAGSSANFASPSPSPAIPNTPNPDPNVIPNVNQQPRPRDAGSMNGSDSGDDEYFMWDGKQVYEDVDGMNENKANGEDADNKYEQKYESNLNSASSNNSAANNFNVNTAAGMNERQDECVRRFVSYLNGGIRAEALHLDEILQLPPSFLTRNDSFRTAEVIRQFMQKNSKIFPPQIQSVVLAVCIIIGMQKHGKSSTNATLLERPASVAGNGNVSTSSSSAAQGGADLKETEYTTAAPVAITIRHDPSLRAAAVASSCVVDRVDFVANLSSPEEDEKFNVIDASPEVALDKMTQLMDHIRLSPQRLRLEPCQLTIRTSEQIEGITVIDMPGLTNSMCVLPEFPQKVKKVTADTLNRWVLQPDAASRALYVMRFSDIGHMANLDGLDLLMQPHSKTRVAVVVTNIDSATPEYFADHLRGSSFGDRGLYNLLTAQIRRRVPDARIFFVANANVNEFFTTQGGGAGYIRAIQNIQKEINLVQGSRTLGFLNTIAQFRKSTGYTQEPELYKELLQMVGGKYLQEYVRSVCSDGARQQLRFLYDFLCRAEAAANERATSEAALLEQLDKVAGDPVIVIRNLLMTAQRVMYHLMTGITLPKPDEYDGSNLPPQEIFYQTKKKHAWTFRENEAPRFPVDLSDTDEKYLRNAVDKDHLARGNLEGHLKHFVYTFFIRCLLVVPRKQEKKDIAASLNSDPDVARDNVDAFVSDVVSDFAQKNFATYAVEHLVQGVRRILEKGIDITIEIVSQMPLFQFYMQPTRQAPVPSAATPPIPSSASAAAPSSTLAAPAVAPTTTDTAPSNNSGAISGVQVFTAADGQAKLRESIRSFLRHEWCDPVCNKLTDLCRTTAKQMQTSLIPNAPMLYRFLAVLMPTNERFVKDLLSNRKDLQLVSDTFAKKLMHYNRLFQGVAKSASMLSNIFGGGAPAAAAAAVGAASAALDATVGILPSVAAQNMAVMQATTNGNGNATAAAPAQSRAAPTSGTRIAVKSEEELEWLTSQSSRQSLIDLLVAPVMSQDGPDTSPRLQSLAEITDKELQHVNAVILSHTRLFAFMTAMKIRTDAPRTWQTLSAELRGPIKYAPVVLQKQGEVIEEAYMQFLSKDFLKNGKALTITQAARFRSSALSSSTAAASASSVKLSSSEILSKEFGLQSVCDTQRSRKENIIQIFLQLGEAKACAERLLHSNANAGDVSDEENGFVNINGTT